MTFGKASYSKTFPLVFSGFQNQLLANSNSSHWVGYCFLHFEWFSFKASQFKPFLWIFRVLHTVQSLVVMVRVVVCLAVTSLFYHIVSALSTTFLFF